MRTSNFLYLAGFSIFVFQGFIETTMFMNQLPGWFTTAFKCIALAFLIFKILAFDVIKNVEYICLVAALFLSGLVICAMSGYKNLMILLVFVIGAFDVDFDQILKAFFIENVVLIAATIVAEFAGIIPNVGIPKSGGTVYSYGFYYTTEFSAHVLFVTLAYLFLRRGDYTYRTLVFSFIPMLMVYLLTQGRLAFFLLTGVLAALAFLRAHREEALVFHPTFRNSYFVLAAISIVLMVVYDGSGILSMLNDLLTGRLYYAHVGYQQYGVTIFGQQIEMQGWGGGRTLWAEDYFYVDCSYLKILLRFGILGLVVSTLVCSIPVFRLKRTACVALTILLAVACSSFINEHMVDLAYNVFAVMAFSRCTEFKAPHAVTRCRRILGASKGGDGA